MSFLLYLEIVMRAYLEHYYTEAEIEHPFGEQIFGSRGWDTDRAEGSSVAFSNILPSFIRSESETNEAGICTRDLPASNDQRRRRLRGFDNFC